jgi:hypothetical protein
MIISLLGFAYKRLTQANADASRLIRINEHKPARLEGMLHRVNPCA